MFGGTVLAEKYNEDQMKIFKKIESGETLTSAEKMFLARTVKKSVEINSIIRSKFKDYYPAE